MDQGSACSVPQDVLLARAYLSRVAEPPAVALWRFVEMYGPRVAAARVRSGDVPDSVRQETDARRELERAEQDIETAASVGARLIVPEDEQWPAWRFVALDLAARRGIRYAGQPLALWVRGDLGCLDERSVAMVGARASSDYGDHVAADLASQLTADGVRVVSGAAFGIDAAAHRGALAAGGPTIAVLACGIDRAYPVAHTNLLERIAENGCVVSEYPPGTLPVRHRFLVRNRLIAALGDATVVVEAGRRSGARNTAATARALGREVLAVPGPITSATSLGCHELLREGDAMVCTSADDVRRACGPLDVRVADRAEGDVLTTLDLPQRQVHDALQVRTGLSAEQIAVASGVTLTQVRAVLPALELSGLAVSEEDGWRCTAPTRRTGT